MGGQSAPLVAVFILIVVFMESDRTGEGGRRWQIRRKRCLIYVDILWGQDPNLLYVPIKNTGQGVRLLGWVRVESLVYRNGNK